MRNRYLDEYVNGSYPVTNSQYTARAASERDLEREQPAIRVIVGGLTMVGDSNIVKKNYERYALTVKEVFFNLPTTEKVKVRQVPIIWMDDDEEGVLYSHEDAPVIKVRVAGKEFQRILVDTSSLVDILFKHTNTSLKDLEVDG